MTTHLFVAKVSPMHGEHAFSNKGLQNFYLTVLAGKQPSKTKFLHGAMADDDVEAGKTYLFQATREDDHPEYGEQWSLTTVGVVSVLELMQMQSQLGPAVVLEADKAKVAEQEPADTASDLMGD